MDKYYNLDDKEYLMIEICGDSLCVRGLMHVNNWRETKLNKLRMGGGWRGAELVNLKYNINEKDSELEFVDVKSILD